MSIISKFIIVEYWIQSCDTDVTTFNSLCLSGLIGGVGWIGGIGSVLSVM